MPKYCGKFPAPPPTSPFWPFTVHRRRTCGETVHLGEMGAGLSGQRPRDLFGISRSVPLMQITLATGCLPHRVSVNFVTYISRWLTY
jgi:hypothetical protein